MAPNGTRIGDLAPPIELPDTGGEMHTLPMPGEATATVVLWTCNHCPYARRWHDRLMDAARDYSAQGVRFLAINSNAEERQPADSLEKMKERVESEDWPCPYLHDQSQETARAWGAMATPDIFVCDTDLRIRYRGAPDADHEDSGQNAVWLRQALDALLSGSAPEMPETDPVGCSIKWRE